MITVVLTSCNRPIELTQTLKSFFKYNTHPIESFIIIDDSGIQGCIDESIKCIPDNINRTIIYNESNIGQIKSIDKAYSLVHTEYIFHLEDDWEFYNSGFIEISLEILKNNRRIFNVWLREYSNFAVLQNGHTIIPQIYDNTYRLMNVFQERSNIWNGFTFNPGLRRTVDCKRLMPYSQFIHSADCNVGGIEQALSINYYKLGFLSAITLYEKGFVKHIGWDNPTKRDY